VIRRHPAIPLIATALILPGLIALGFWQLGRSAEKRETRDLVAERATQDRSTLPTTPVTASDWRWREVSVTGTYDDSREFLVDNKVLGGRPGYHVITPLEQAGSQTLVLINRGWVPWGNDRTTLPATPIPAGEQTVSGRAVEPTSEFLQLAAEPSASGWPRLWQNLDMARFRDLSSQTVQPVVIELSPDAAVGGFERTWRTQDDGWVERHHGYAMQWFGLAATLVVINLILWRRRQRSTGNPKP